ncbi:hypothetical protein BKP35_08890 [Anaerobacillus arseniciselenatis]|uniref:Peptidase M24 domain-containing protein n=1 Tax=Anaerobacillus arseniciselenatis TaxID=85682 RepID=A0A1S2LMX0_9BACI|nr:aminopeptidase P family protein [Anaerobacillus arseniciselenatis]OIJ13879.1 hypothetical protein BKP35_08890 [Anaerobacillus arseniciselenatis]
MFIEVQSHVEDLTTKVKNVRGFLQINNYDAVFYQRTDNFAWITSGGYNGIPYNSETGECGLLVTSDNIYLVTNTIEKPRVVNEEIASLPIEVIEYPWYEDITSAVWRVVKKGKVATDTLLDGFDLKTAELSKLRFSLTELELDRYRDLGLKATQLMEQFCMTTITPGQTELEIAANLNQVYLSNGLLPTVTLVACDERIDLFRHPIATNKRFEKKCMVVSCVSYKGLIVAITRIVHNGKISQSLNDKFLLTATIDAQLIEATKVGTPAGQMFDKIKQFYEEVGYRGEWKYHHQGGAIGYQNRDYLITPMSQEVFQPNQAFAWNPSIKGTKSEDTIITGVTKPEIITVSNSGWPQLKINIGENDTLQRPAILEL